MSTGAEIGCLLGMRGPWFLENPLSIFERILESTGKESSCHLSAMILSTRKSQTCISVPSSPRVLDGRASSA